MMMHVWYVCVVKTYRVTCNFSRFSWHSPSITSSLALISLTEERHDGETEKDIVPKKEGVGGWAKREVGHTNHGRVVVKHQNNKTKSHTAGGTHTDEPYTNFWSFEKHMLPGQYEHIPEITPTT